MGIKKIIKRLTTTSYQAPKRFPVRPLKPSKGKVPKGKPSNGVGVGY